LDSLAPSAPWISGDMGEAREIPAHGLVDPHLAECVGQVVVAANDMGDRHVVVVHDHRMQISGRAVAAQDDQVVHLSVGDADRALHQVLDHRFALTRCLQANRGFHAGGGVPGIAIAPTAVVARGTALGERLFAHLLQLLRRAVAVISVAPLQHLMRDLGVAGGVGGLENSWFVAGKAKPVETFQDRPRGSVGGTFAVGVLDPQQESAAVVAGEQVVEQRGAGGADVQQPGWARGETGADGHGWDPAWERRGGGLAWFGAG